MKVTRRVILFLFACFLVSSGCSGSREDPVTIDRPDQLSQAQYALLFGNISGGYRMDGSAEGVLWLVNDTGRVVAESSRFAPLEMAGLRRHGDDVYFLGEGAGYRLDSGGLSYFPREHPYASISVMEALPSGDVLGVLNGGASEDGGYLMMIWNLTDPTADVAIDRYVEAIATCGSETFLLTTEGLEPSGGRWEELATGDIVSGPEAEVVYNLTTAMRYPCSGSQIFAVEWIAGEASPISEIRLVAWNLRTSFGRSSIPLVDTEGNPLGGDHTWQDGSRLPYHFWLINDDLFWVNLAGELWRTRVDSGVSEMTFKAAPIPGSRSVAITPMDSSFVRAVQEAEHIRISEHALDAGESSGKW